MNKICLTHQLLYQ